MVPGYPDYEVSDEGRVRRVTPTWKKNRAVPFILKQTIGAGVYPRVYLTKRDADSTADRRQTCIPVHHLVVAAFIGPRDQGMQINHKNLDKTNNRLENLEYVTPSQNMRHAFDNGAMPWYGKPVDPRAHARGERAGGAKLSAEQAAYILRSSERVVDLAARFGVSTSAISYIRNGKRWQHLKEHASD